MIETVVYIALLAVLLLTVVTSILAMGSAVASIKSSRSVTINAVSSLERLSRGIREAKSIDPSSVFGSNPGRLVLVNENPNTLITSTLTFFISNYRLYAQKSGESAVAITGNDIIVSNLVFREISLNNSAAVKIEMTLRSSSNKNVHSRNYYDTVVLRNSYQ